MSSTPSPSPSPDPQPTPSPSSSGGSSPRQPAPTPTATPQMAPVAPNPSDPDKVTNEFKQALKCVYDRLLSAEKTLEADTATSDDSKGAKLTRGLGKYGSVWESTAAENAATDIRGMVSDILLEVINTTSSVGDAWRKEPDLVDKDEEKAKAEWW